jgi:hypothetical protein
VKQKNGSCIFCNKFVGSGQRMVGTSNLEFGVQKDHDTSFYAVLFIMQQKHGDGADILV